MPKSRQQKAETIKAVVEKLGQAKSVVFTHFTGLKVKEVDELRRLCRAEGVEYLVIKKTLMAKAFPQAAVRVDPATFSGEVATAFGFADEVAPAKILARFAKDHPALQPFGGIFEQAYVDAAKISQLAELPSRVMLLTKLVGSCAAPISGLVNVLAGNLRGLVQVLTAIGQKA